MATVRLDSYVQREIERIYGIRISRTYVERVLEQGGVKLHDEIIKKKGFKVKPEKHKIEFQEDIIKNILSVYQTGRRRDIEASQWDASEAGIEIDDDRVARAGDIAQNIVFENDDIVAVNKPHGVSSHPGKGDRGADSMVYQFIKYMRNVYRYVPRAGLLHRLDKDTGGILLFAKNMETYNEVKTQFENRHIQKFYIAKCVRTPRLNNMIKRYIAKYKIQPSKENEQYTEKIIDSIIDEKKPIELSGFIARKRGSNSMIFTPDSRIAGTLIHAKECISDIFVLNADSDEVVLLFVPHTGRTHQIRAQAKFLGCPIANDPIYGRLITPKGILGLTAKGIRFKIRNTEYSIFL